MQVNVIGAGLAGCEAALWLADAGVQVDDLQLPITLISGGKLLKNNLKLLGKTAAWIEEQLQNYNCSVKSVYLMTAEPGGKLYLSIKQEA